MIGLYCISMRTLICLRSYKSKSWWGTNEAHITRCFWPELPPAEELSTSSWPSDDLLPPAPWWRWSTHTHKQQWFYVCIMACVCLSVCEQPPLSRRWAAWSSCRCRTAPPPLEPRASRHREEYPGSCHVSSGFYGNQWSSGSVDGKDEANVTYQTNWLEGLFIPLKIEQGVPNCTLNYMKMLVLFRFDQTLNAGVFVNCNDTW